ncbi:hypothetical protein [Bacillus toyonensis]|uniref:hypothetical protein n=1 Tax=Bacillus toyonensis TaxID=155322 RepID=UPI000BF0B944|nr:hypothetical protein [Bacillus toyonensis]PEM58647.1 hypothetical protein CN625_23615 [Bacillus toyonensis]PHD38229.1 hypothetical protein COF48_00275 [Bacillus toyonensis]
MSRVSVFDRLNDIENEALLIDEENFEVTGRKIAKESDSLQEELTDIDEEIRLLEVEVSSWLVFGIPLKELPDKLEKLEEQLYDLRSKLF